MIYHDSKGNVLNVGDIVRLNGSLNFEALACIDAFLFNGQNMQAKVTYLEEVPHPSFKFISLSSLIKDGL